MKRILEYKTTFTAKYNLDKLVYWEAFQEIGDVITRENN